MFVIPAAQETKVGTPSPVQDLPGLQSKFKTSQGSSELVSNMGVGEMGWKGDRGWSEIELFIELRKGQNLLKFFHIFEKKDTCQQHSVRQDGRREPPAMPAHSEGE